MGAQGAEIAKRFAFLIAKSHSNGHHQQSNPEPPIGGLAINS